MNEKTLKNLRSRTDAKLRYAEIHLDELKSVGVIGGSDFDRAHQEAFLFQLLGAKEAFLIELNAYYELSLPNIGLTVGKLRKSLKEQGKHSPELAKLFSLERDEDSWLSQAKVMRDYSTHVSGIIHKFHLGRSAHQQVWLRNPTTGKYIEIHFPEIFLSWHVKMKDLLDNLRASAIESLRTEISST